MEKDVFKYQVKFHLINSRQNFPATFGSDHVVSPGYDESVKT